MKRTAAAALAFGVALAAWADYPERPITIVVPFAAGGPTDKIARDLGEALRKPLGGATIMIANIGGAGGTFGAAKVARATPDGYTLLLHHIGMATSTALYRNLPFKVLEDFEFAGMVNDVPMVLIGRPTLPANNFAELRKWIDDIKGKVNLAHTGLGAASQLCGLLFQQTVAVDMTALPYKGSARAMLDMLGSRVDIMCDTSTNTWAQIERNSVKAYAVTTVKPLTNPVLKSLPTLDSQGLTGFNVTLWHGVYAPKGTPKDVVDKLNAALRSALMDPEFSKRQEALGGVIVTDDRLSPAGHRKFVADEIAKWGKAIKTAGMYAD